MRKQKGISLIVLVITISVILLIAGAVITTGIGNLKTKNLMSMYTDLKSISDKISLYYNQYGTLPLSEKFMGRYDFKSVANPNDDEEGYYVININRLDKLILTKKLTWEENDVYIINTKTHMLYYPEGVELDGEMYYRLPGEYSKLDITSNENIQISASPTGRMTAEDVTVTIVWPEVGDNIVKQIKIGSEEWQTVTGEMNKVVLTKNTTVVAKMTDTDGDGDVSTAKITVNNIDKNAPILNTTVENTKIALGTTKTTNDYFKIETNGKAKINSIEYIDISNDGEVIENLNTLTLGTHIIQCTVTKETGIATSARITMEVVEPGVYGNLYKISDAEYHLIFNDTGAIAQGYTESQLVGQGTNIVNGSEVALNSEGYNVNTQPWGAYSTQITKVKIEEKIKPISTANYFRYLPNITEIEGISNLDTSNTVDMQYMFAWSSKLTNLDVSGFDTINVTNMSHMFRGCSNIGELDVSDWNTVAATNMDALFYGCSSLTSLNINKWNTENVTTMNSMIRECSNLTSLDLSDLNTSKVTNMFGMFYGCTGLITLNIIGFDTSNVTDMMGMFEVCSNLISLDISNFNTSKVTEMYAMFAYSSKLRKIYVGDGWSTSAVTRSTDMFYDCISLSGAITYDSAKTDARYANYTTGYLTYKASQ